MRPECPLALSDAVRYRNLRPWQPRLALDANTEPLQKRVARLRAAWQTSRLADVERAIHFNVFITPAISWTHGRNLNLPLPSPFPSRHATAASRGA